MNRQPGESACAPVHFYRPDRWVRTPRMRSPDYVQLSTAAAITLGLLPGAIYRAECTQCLNLLVTYPEGCRANCAYCGLARHREESWDYADRNFIRVDWPTVDFETVLQRVTDGADEGRFERMCLSMITHPNSDQDTLELLRRWIAVIPDIPVSILSNPTTLNYPDVEAFRAAGADIFTVALDAATPEVFARTRGEFVSSPHRWSHYWRTIEGAAEIFGPEKFGVHLICGMGETELEILSAAQRIRDLGGHNHMFAFYPERGSLMEDWSQAPRDQWRRVQLGRFIIDYREGRLEDMAFDEHGRLLNSGLPKDQLEALLVSGKPFRTSGCPGKYDEEISACNRPYGDSSPSDIYSFPFALEPEDVGRVRRQMAGEEIPTSDT